MSKHILFISSVNLTTNPRILKEIKLAVQLGKEVSFIGFRLGNWSDKIEEKHKHELSGLVSLVYLDATSTNFIQWLISTVFEKISRLFYSLNKSSFFLNYIGHSKRSYILNCYLKNNNLKKPDIVIAHTLGTLYPAFKYAQKNKVSFAFDVEDFHPGEKIHSDFENEKQRRIFLLNKILPHAQYISCAAPLIAFEMQNLLKASKKSEDFIVTVNNTFSKNEFTEPINIEIENTTRLKFIWFSQNISFGRGLEEIIPVLKHYAEYISLELIGRMDSVFFDEIIQPHLEWIHITEPLDQTSLHQYLANFDIGLATEMNNADYNREIALTNKIIAYYQAGLYILATDTKAQLAFLSGRPNAGICAGQSQEQFKLALEKILLEKATILENKSLRFEDAKQFNWEMEANKLVKKWNEVVQL